MLRLLLDRGADIEYRCTRGSTPLLAACTIGYMEGVELLVQRSADLSAHDYDGATCLQTAQEKEHHSIVSYLLKNDSSEMDVSAKDSLNHLHSLILIDGVTAISRLVSRGVDINARYPVRSQSLLLSYNYFIGWHCGYFHCCKTSQEQSIEGVVGCRCGPKHRHQGIIR